MECRGEYTNRFANDFESNSFHCIGFVRHFILTPILRYDIPPFALQVRHIFLRFCLLLLLDWRVGVLGKEVIDHAREVKALLVEAVGCAEGNRKTLFRE